MKAPRKFEIIVTLTIEAENADQAQMMAAACVEYWSERDGLSKIQGVGGAKGEVLVRESP